MQANIDRLTLLAQNDNDAARALLREGTRRCDTQLVTLAWDCLYSAHRSALGLTDDHAAAAVVVRHCARCSRELTDPASRAHGIGPVCRRRSNRALAQLIEADLDAAASYVDAMRAKLPGAPVVVAELLDGVASQINTAHAEDVEGLDWRPTIRAIEVALSFALASALVKALYNITAALGYVALVHLWRDEVVKGKASLRFDADKGLLLLTSPSSRNHALSELIAASGGSYLRRERVWAWAATRHAEVSHLLPRHWLGLDETGVVEVLAAAAAWQPPAGWEEPKGWRSMRDLVMGQRTTTAAKPAVRAEKERGGFHTHSPHNAAFVAAIKTMPREHRRWDGSARAWWVSDNRHALSDIRGHVLEHYSVDLANALGIAANDNDEHTRATA